MPPNKESKMNATKKIFNGRKFVKIDEVYLEDEYFNTVCQTTVPPSWIAYADGIRHMLCDGYRAKTAKEAMALATHHDFQ